MKITQFFQSAGPKNGGNPPTHEVANSEAHRGHYPEEIDHIDVLQQINATPCSSVILVAILLYHTNTWCGRLRRGIHTFLLLPTSWFHQGSPVCTWSATLELENQ
ncbi:hypothetical protein WAI453_006202 [Rhynchosporium graminicola]